MYWGLFGCIPLRWRMRVASLVVCVFPMQAACQIDGGTFSATGTDTVPRYFHAGGRLLHGPVMISGGLNLSIFPPTLISRSDISFYDPTSKTFSVQFDPLDGSPPTTPTLSVARSSHTQTTLHDGRVLITGGNRNASGTSPGNAFDGVEVFDPMTGIVSAGPSMSAARAMHTATLLPDGRVVIAGGASWQFFNPSTDTWSGNFTLYKTRTAHAAVLLADYAGTPGDDRVLLIGGNGRGPDTLELLDLGTMTSLPMVSKLSVGVDDLAAIELLDGRVLIAGGQDTSTGNTVANVDLFDPVADTIVAGPDVPNRSGGIADHQFVRFADRVVILGGEEQQGGVDTILNYAAIFDAEIDQWIANGTMLNMHDDFVSVPLDTCELLIVGGGIPFLGQEIPSASSEVFALNDAAQCLPGDLDNDGNVDANDYQRFALCIAGPNEVTPPIDCIHLDFVNSDLNTDTAVDLSDFASFAEFYSEQ